MKPLLLTYISRRYGPVFLPGTIQRLSMGGPMKLFTSVFAAILFVSASVFANDIQPVFEALRDQPVDYEPVGQICEQVARLQLYNEYPSNRYTINVGVEYSVQHRTIGELDIVISENKTREVVLVGEVKCWKDLGGALDKAKDQRSRFIRTLQKQGPSIVFESHEGAPFVARHFRSPKYVAIAQLGSVNKGFDINLDYTLHELMELRELLLRCQAQGECARP